MTDPEREQANTIITELQERLYRCEGQGSPHSGVIGQSPLCEGCYRWRIGFAVAFGAALGAAGWEACRRRTALLQSVFGDAEATQFVVTFIASLLPVALVALDWKIRLYKAGMPGVLRALANMLAEFKKGLRE